MCVYFVATWCVHIPPLEQDANQEVHLFGFHLNELTLTRWVARPVHRDNGEQCSERL